jgi:acylphosphatase
MEGRMQRHAMRLIVTGRVQGVGYRWWVSKEAQALGLSGWVRNRQDGSVELLAIGVDAALDRLERACGRGPRAAVVQSVTRTQAQDDGSEGFRQIATA